MDTFPFYKQAFAKDCGPTCLKMIAKFHGKDFNPDMMLNFSNIRMYGCSLTDLYNAALGLGFTPEAYMSNVELLNNASLPIMYIGVPTTSLSYITYLMRCIT